MKKYITRIALILLVATSVRSYLFLRGESIHYNTFFGTHTELIDQPATQTEPQEAEGILPDLLLLYEIGRKMANLLPAS